jgi:hypothetical protein
LRFLKRAKDEGKSHEARDRAFEGHILLGAQAAPQEVLVCLGYEPE